MLLIQTDISHMPITELETTRYRPPGGNLDKLESQLQSFKSQLEKIKGIHKANTPLESMLV